MASIQEDSTQNVAALLNGKKTLKRAITERGDMRDALREGLPFGALEAFAHALDFTKESLTGGIGIAPPTLARRKAQRILNAVESDRLYRLARVTQMAVHTLRSLEKAKHWLDRPNRTLSGETPLSLLDTDIGARQVETILGRIDHGIFS